MLFTKSKKTIISLAAVAVMTLAGASAFAASSQLTLTPVDNVDITKIDAKMGDPSDIKVAGKIDPKVLEGMKNAATAPKASLVNAAADDVDVSRIDAKMGDPSDLKVAGKIDPKVLEGMKNATTAPRK